MQRALLYHYAYWLIDCAHAGSWRGDVPPEFAGVKSTTAGRRAEVVALDSDAAFSRNCVTKGVLCVIAALRKDAPAFEQQLEVLKDAAARHLEEPVMFGWLDGAEFGGFLRHFNVPPSSLPEVLLLSPKKLRYALMHDRLTGSNLDDLVRGALSGRVGTTQLAALPALEKGDAGDEGGPEQSLESDEELAVEEEFDLGDIMSEDIDAAVGTKSQKLQEIEEEEQQQQQQQQKKKSKTKKSKKKAAKSAHTEL